MYSVDNVELRDGDLVHACACQLLQSGERPARATCLKERGAVSRCGTEKATRETHREVHLGADSVDELRAAVDRVHQVNKTIDLSVHTVQAGSPMPCMSLRRTSTGRLEFTCSH